jgi:membrane-bound lytic murein transglycosylase D
VVSRVDVERQMFEMLGDSAASLAPGDATAFVISSDLDIVSYASHDRVVFFVDAFSNASRERTRTFLTRGTRYEPMIRAKLRTATLPEDLYYLAFIESGYDLDAYSSAAAVGMWQFMTATAKGEGLKVDWWVDERRDPVAATDAAVKHLSWLRRQFGSLFLSAAAYNGGTGGG